MNTNPAINVLNTRIFYIIFTAIMWAMSIALWIMFGFAYFIATLVIGQVTFYIAEWTLYRINPIDVLLMWRYCGKHAANTYVLNHIINS